MEMNEIKYEILKNGSLVKELTIKSIKPCIASEGKVRVLMQLDASLENVIPSLMTMYPPGKVNYVKNKKILTLSIFNRLITIYPSGKVTMNKTIDKEEAIEVITDILKDINTAYDTLESSGGAESLDEGLEESRSIDQIGPMDIYKCLPQSNCEECGEATCLAFALKLLAGDQELKNCLPLHEPWNQQHVECLEELLGAPLMKTMGGMSLN